jgi:O-antigen ligase
MRRQKVAWSASLIALLAFCLWLPVSLLFASYLLDRKDLIVAVFYIVRFALMAGTIAVTAALFDTEQKQNRLLSALAWSGVILLGLGFAQLILIPDFSFMAKYGWDPHVKRMLSTFFDPNFFGMYLVFMASFILAWLLTPKTHKYYRWLMPLFLLVVLGIAATLSRSTFLALIVSTLIIVGIRSWRVVLVVIVALAIAGMATPRLRQRIVGAFQIDATAKQRLAAWHDTIVIIQERPLTGAGYNAYSAAEERNNVKSRINTLAARGSDSSILFVLATTGVIGLILYMTFLVSLMTEAVLLLRFGTTPFWNATGLALTGIIPAYIVHSQFVNGLFYPLLFIPFAFMAGLMVRGVTHLKNPTREPSV